MKTRMYWTYATRSLARGGQRSLLAIFCVAVGVLAIVALQLVGNAVNASFTANVRALNGGDVAITNTTDPVTPNQLSYFDQLRAQGTITTYTAVDAVSGQAHLATGSRMFQALAVNPAQFPLAGSPVFTTPSSGSLSKLLHNDQVVITTTLALALNVKVGDTVQMNTQDGRAATVIVGGIIQSTAAFKGSVLLVSLADYATFPSANGQPVSYNTIYTDVPDHTDANSATLVTQVQNHFPLAATVTTKQLLANNAAQVQQVHYFLQVVGLLALLIGGVGIINTMQVLLRRRRIEIAMLKTMGYQRNDLYALFGLETGLIGLLGGLVGAAAGVGVSFLVRILMEDTLQIILPATIDPLTVASGVAVGFLTALIFGLMPIVQAAQVRPLAVLREMPEDAGWRSRSFAAMLLGLIAVLFFFLALSILQNVGVALGVVGGTGIFLGLLGLVLGRVVWIISKLPVLDRFTVGYTVLVGGAVLAAAALTVFIPAFGLLCLTVAVIGLIVVVLPRTTKTNVKLALRNIGRQNARTVTTLLALYIGVFAVGLILVFGQNIKNSLSSFVASGDGINAEIIAANPQKANVETQLAGVTGIKHLAETSLSQAVPTAVNGQPIGQFVQTATSGTTYTVKDVTAVMTGVQGYDLAHGTMPDQTDTKLVQGSHDATLGRLLIASDVGTANAVLPLLASQAPNNLKLGDTITVVSQADKTPVTLIIVGFYNVSLPQLEPMLTDSSIAATLSGGQPEYGFRMHLDPSTVDQTLAGIQNSAPGVTTLSIADFVDQFANQLNSLIAVLEAVASLALLASVIIIANAVALAMLERRRELGILKSVGFTSRNVLGEVLVENGIVGFTGGLLSMLVVVATATLLGKVLFHLPIAVPTLTVLGIVGATTLVCMLVAAAVAWAATRVRPVEVLRYE